MAKADSRLGFSVRLEPRPGMTEREGRRLLQALEEYFESHGLAATGTQLQWLVYSDQRSLSEADQVDLLDWLIGQPGISQVLLMPLTTRRDCPGVIQDGFVALRTSELWVVGLTLLYRCRRLTPTLYLQVLGGYVRPVAH